CLPGGEYPLVPVALWYSFPMYRLAQGLSVFLPAEHERAYHGLVLWGCWRLRWWPFSCPSFWPPMPLPGRCGRPRLCVAEPMRGFQIPPMRWRGLLGPALQVLGITLLLPVGGHGSGRCQQWAGHHPIVIAGQC